jgi:hypothetical protein
MAFPLRNTLQTHASGDEKLGGFALQGLQPLQPFQHPVCLSAVRGRHAAPRPVGGRPRLVPADAAAIAAARPLS